MKFLYLNIITFVFFSNIFAQNFELQKAYADSLFTAEQYFDAITEYKRLLFFDKREKYKFESNYKIGMSYKAGAKFNEAIKYFAIAKNNCKDNLMKVNVELEIIKSNILRRTIFEAINRLTKLGEKYPNEIDSLEINYWRGWAYIVGDDWDSASIEFSKIDSLHPLKELSDNVVDEKYSVSFATVISYLIPGSGQIYTGNYLSGFMSLGWNVLWGYLTINAFITERAVEGILIGGLLWTRFYRGNIQNAEKFAISKNREISNKAYQYLDKEFKGKKP